MRPSRARCRDARYQLPHIPGLSHISPVPTPVKRLCTTTRNRHRSGGSHTPPSGITAQDAPTNRRPARNYDRHARSMSPRSALFPFQSRRWPQHTTTPILDTVSSSLRHIQPCAASSPRQEATIRRAGLRGRWKHALAISISPRRHANEQPPPCGLRMYDSLIQ